jgi:pimeloyl-ACP methyl ester carboxylesterase
MDRMIVQLSDGRVLGGVEAGARDGSPVLFFAGFGMAASALHPDGGVAEALGLRLIAVDRPGIGRSSPSPGRTLSDWARDIRELTERLGIGRFGLLGWSGGGPHALACAHHLPERIWATALFAGAPPLADQTALAAMPWAVRPLAFMARHAPWLLRLGFGRQCRQIRRDPEAVMRRAMRSMPAADQAVIRDPRFHDCLRQSMVEACSQGPQGLCDDVLAIAGPWGFAPQAIRCPVQLWHGELDRAVPAAVGRWLAARFVQCSSHFLPQEGHFGYLTHWREILSALADSSPDSAMKASSSGAHPGAR